MRHSDGSDPDSGPATETSQRLDDALRTRELVKVQLNKDAEESPLENPELYTRPSGLDDAKRLGAELEVTKRELDAALARWSAASDALELTGRES